MARPAPVDLPVEVVSCELMLSVETFNAAEEGEDTEDNGFVVMKKNDGGLDEMNMILKGSFSDIPRIQEITEHLTQGVILDLQVECLFRRPSSNNTFRSSANTLFKKCKIEYMYTGQFPSETEDVLKGFEIVRELLVSLHSPEDADSLFTFLRRRAELERPLKFLGINVGNLTVEMLETIPQGAIGNYAIAVFFPDVTNHKGEGNVGRDHKSVGDVLRKLNPPEFERPFGELYFPRYQIIDPSSGVKDLLHKLKGCRVETELGFPGRCMPEDSIEEMIKEDYQRILQCRNGIWWGDHSDDLFDMDSWE